MSSGSSQALTTEEVVTGLLADTLEARLGQGLSSDTHGWCSPLHQGRRKYHLPGQTGWQLSERAHSSEALGVWA